MGQDLRKLFEAERARKKYQMKAGHEDRFAQRLEAALPKRERKRPIYWWSVAASLLVLVGVATYFILNSGQALPDTKVRVVDGAGTPTEMPGISLGDLSPDLQKIEHYYVTNINFELSELNVSEENKEMVDGYMERLAELDKEYRTLNEELNALGPNDETISALIQNLQLRLQLLQKLKQKLNHIKSSKNEQEIYNI